MRSVCGGMVLGAALLGACGGDSSGPRETGTIAVAAGDGQSATVGTVLQPYQVLVNTDMGVPRADVTVTWTLQGGGGSLSSATSVTDVSGIAEVASTLGTTAGPQVVRASISGYVGSPVSFQSTGTAGPASGLLKVSGDNQIAGRSQAVTTAPTVRVTDGFGNGVAGTTVNWQVTAGGGAAAGASSVSGPTGNASVAWTLGDTAGPNTLTATFPGGPSVAFAATAVPAFSIDGGGNNVAERFTSDLWVADGYAYTGTWGFRGNAGNAVKIWQLDVTGAPALADSIVVANVGTISDIEVSADGQWLVFTTEGGSQEGLYVYELTAPGTAVFRAKSVSAPNGLHTGTLATIGGTLYAFGAKDPGGCALVIYNLSQATSGTITIASSTSIPDNYCIHDTFVRDGYAFVFAWNEGLYIFDVGNGSHGGSPTAPAQVSKTAGFGGETHNGWWFHNPVSNQKRYLFIGEEGPGTVGSSSSGDIHVVDVTNLAAPVEVASFSLPGAGVHNFWVDEPNQRLYAAYYNGGVVALDISGTLTGSLATRVVAQVRPGGPGGTYVWGVMLFNGSLYASDMLTGLWQLGLP